MGCQANDSVKGEAVSPSALQSGDSAEAEVKTMLRGRAGGYDVFVLGAKPSEARIGHVGKEMQGTWEAVRHGKTVHRGSKRMKDAVKVLIAAHLSSAARP